MQFVREGPDVPERLLQAHEDGRVVFFCGAGISYPARLPGFSGLVTEVYTRLKITPDPVQAAAFKSKRYDTAVGLLESNIVGGRQAVRERIAEILNPDVSSANATATHDALLTLGECRARRTRLVTTNFDRLFEHAVANRRHSVERFEAPLLPVPKNRWDGLVYLHGLLPEDSTGSNLDNLVVSSGDFGLAYLTERWAARFVSELLRNFVVCFVGYSIDDPVLRYMMDALAADRLLGELPPEMFAFGSYRKGKMSAQANEWRAKNVTPILYRKHWRHAYLHRTLRTWAQTYRDGVRGKERIVTEYAMARPDTAATHDDFVSRMLWALSDPTGLPAKRFADLEPVPSLDWVEPMTENRFGHADLIRFGVPPKDPVDRGLSFSLMRRPAPYDLAPQMALADGVSQGSRYDKVMAQLARWLLRHLNNPNLLLWMVKHGGVLHTQMAEQIAWRLSKITDLELAGEDDKLERIRNSAPDAIPDLPMRTLWGLLLARRIELAGREMDLDGWRRRLVRHGLTTTLRLELSQMLAPQVILRAPFTWPFDDDADADGDGVEQRSIRELVDWEIALAASGVHETLGELKGNERWASALPSLLDDFTALLRDALDLMRELGDADDQTDFSYVNQPSISEHAQNSALHDWTALIELNRDAWRATAPVSPVRARLTAETWLQLPYPVFRRLAFFAAAESDVIPTGKGLDWLLADDGWWLWSIETQRETMRLLVAFAPRIDQQELPRLERAILTGPPRNMFKPDLDEQRWTDLQEREIWLRLAKISHAGARLGDAARERLNGLSARHPDWQLADDERDEFPSWTSDGSELLIHVTTPRQRNELVEWLREHPQPGEWRHEDDWRQRCREDYDDAVYALTALARDGIWPTGRWREALQVWSEDELSERAWREVGPVLRGVPAAELQQLAHAVGWWLQELARVFEGQQATFLSLCDSVLGLDYQDEQAEDNIVGRAINHPVGLVTEALLRWWYRAELKNDQGLAEEPQRRFTRLCDTETPIFRHGRVLLATHLISLFRVDPEWATQYLIPLFYWQDDDAEARSAWAGFLRSGRLYPPLMEVLKPAFLDTANHYDRLGRHARQYAWLLTFAGLDPGDVFRNRELALAMQALPRNALKHAANTVFRAVDGAGDQRAEYWRNRADPYLNAIWPKAPQMMSEGVSENFARACIAAGDAFTDALGRAHAWLQPLPFPDRIARALHQAKIDSRFPERSLELFRRIVADDTQALFMHLPTCLNTIRTVQPPLEHDHRFQRLVAILRANGGDLD